MFHHGRQRHRERFRKIANGDDILPLQPRQQRTACGVGHSGKRAVEAIGFIVNHLVKYQGAAEGVKSVSNRFSYEPEAALRSAIASSLDHSAGPAILAISQPEPSTSTEVGMPSASPALFKS